MRIKPYHCCVLKCILGLTSEYCSLHGVVKIQLLYSPCGLLHENETCFENVTQRVNTAWDFLSERTPKCIPSYSKTTLYCFNIVVNSVSFRKETWFICESCSQALTYYPITHAIAYCYNITDTTDIADDFKTVLIWQMMQNAPFVLNKMILLLLGK